MYLWICDIVENRMDIKSTVIRDRRVENLLIKKGYELSDCKIFYCSVKGWLFDLCILFISLMVISLYLIPYHYLYIYPISFGIFANFSYLIFAYLNNSFVLTAHELIIINPNLPFVRFTKFGLENISRINIGNSRVKYINWLFLQYSGNYIQVFFKNKSKKYYCTSFSLDAFDEHYTQKAIDSVYDTLKQKQITTNIYS